MKESNDIDTFLQENKKQPSQQKPQIETNKNEDSVWFPIKSIPSRNKQYPKGTLIEGKSIGYRHIKKFSFVDESSAIHVMRKIANDCIRGIDVDEITVEDLRYIFLWLRANSMNDSDFEMTYTCQHCDGISPLKVNPSEFDMTFLDIDVEPVKIGEDEIEIKLITSGRDKEINETIEKLIIEYDDWDDNDSDDVILSAWVHKINGKEVTVEEAYKKCFGEWSPKQTIPLLKHIKKYEYGIHDTVSANCIRCSKENKVGVEFSDLFFFPTV